MKKILLSLAVMSLMSASAFAGILGKVSTVDVDNNGIIKVVIAKSSGGNTYSQPLVGTADAIKAMYAMILTAKSTSADVDVTLGTVDSITGWKKIILQ